MPRCGLPAVVLAITELYGKGLVNMNNEIKQQPSAPVASNTKDKPLNSKQPVKKQRRPLLEIKNLTKKQKENLINGEKLSTYIHGKIDCRRYRKCPFLDGFQKDTWKEK